MAVMLKGNHITAEDITIIINNEGNGFAGEEALLPLLEHLAGCGECTERMKAHRRLEILLEHWSPALHGQVFREREAQRQAQESREAGREGSRADGTHTHHDHDHEEDEDEEWDSDEDCDGEDGCDCGHDHSHSH